MIRAASRTVRQGTAKRRRSVFPETLKREIWERDKGICVYCHEPGYEIDHVVPCSKGGPSIRANGVLCCPSCNRRKKNGIIFDWLFIAFFHLLDTGETLQWLDELWERTMSEVR